MIISEALFLRPDGCCGIQACKKCLLVHKTEMALVSAAFAEHRRGPTTPDLYTVQTRHTYRSASLSIMFASNTYNQDNWPVCPLRISIQNKCQRVVWVASLWILFCTQVLNMIVCVSQDDPLYLQKLHNATSVGIDAAHGHCHLTESSRCPSRVGPREL